MNVIACIFLGFISTEIVSCNKLIGIPSLVLSNHDLNYNNFNHDKLTANMKVTGLKPLDGYKLLFSQISRQATSTFYWLLRTGLVGSIIFSYPMPIENSKSFMLRMGIWTLIMASLVIRDGSILASKTFVETTGKITEAIENSTLQTGMVIERSVNNTNLMIENNVQDTLMIFERTSGRFGDDLKVAAGSFGGDIKVAGRTFGDDLKVAMFILGLSYITGNLVSTTIGNNRNYK